MSALMSNRLLTLVNKFGSDVTLTKNSYAAYNPATGSTGTNTTTNYTVKAYFAEYNLSEMGNDNIVMGDRKVLIPYLDTSGVVVPEPDADDIIVGRGDTVKIVGVSKIYSGNSLVCYTCQVRE
jgi:hypothetical protein